jgi:hypothetical protein
VCARTDTRRFRDGFSLLETAGTIVRFQGCTAQQKKRRRVNPNRCELGAHGLPGGPECAGSRALTLFSADLLL